jgi:hypothetical protein
MSDPSRIEYRYNFSPRLSYDFQVASFHCPHYPKCSFTTIQLPHLHEHLSQHSRPLPDKTMDIEVERFGVNTETHTWWEDEKPKPITLQEAWEGVKKLYGLQFKGSE